jgi:hypothetical protein
MSAFLASIVSLFSRLTASAAKFVFSAGALAFLGPIAPIISGIGQLIGGVVTAIAEIIASLSKSPEGRVALCLLVAGTGFFYLRYHYIEEGKAAAPVKIVTIQKPCPASALDRRKR